MYLILVFSIGKDGEIVKPAEMEKLKKFIDDDIYGTKLLDAEFIEVYKNCYNWVCDKGNLDIKEGQSTFETLEDIFVTKLYLEPALKILKNPYKKVFDVRLEAMKDGKVKVTVDLYNQKSIDLETAAGILNMSKDEFLKLV